MFRRTEEKSEADALSPQGSLLASGFEESVTVVSPEQAQPAARTATAPTASHAPAAPAARQSASAASTANEGLQRPQVSAATGAGAGAGAFRATAPMERHRAPEAKAPAATAPLSTAAAERQRGETRRVLTVGAEILLKGEIAACDRLVIEGKVDANLNDIGTVELADSGSFKGVATVENAEISGLFEGELTVRGKLVIRACGRVRGKITYGEIEIERGGELTGEIKTIASASAPAQNARERARDDRVAA